MCLKTFGSAVAWSLDEKKCSEAAELRAVVESMLYPNAIYEEIEYGCRWQEEIFQV